MRLKVYVQFSAQKTILLSFAKFAQSLWKNSAPPIQAKTSDCDKQNNCSTPKVVDTLDSFHLSPLQAIQETETESTDE